MFKPFFSAPSGALNVRLRFLQVNISSTTLNNFHSAQTNLSQQQLGIVQLKETHTIHTVPKPRATMIIFNREYSNVPRRPCCTLNYRVPPGNGHNSCQKCSQSWYAMFCLSGQIAHFGLLTTSTLFAISPTICNLTFSSSFLYGKPHYVI